MAKKTIGIQIGAVLFADGGVEPVLDILQSKASDNTLFIAAFTYGRGIAGVKFPDNLYLVMENRSMTPERFMAEVTRPSTRDTIRISPSKTYGRPTSVRSTCSRKFFL